MRVPLLALLLLLTLAAPAGAMTVRQTVGADGADGVRRVEVEGTADADVVEASVEDDGTVVLLSGGDLNADPTTPACSTSGPGQVRCAPDPAARRTVLAFDGAEGDDRLAVTGGTEVEFAGGDGDDRLETTGDQRLPVVATGDDGQDHLEGGALGDRLRGGADSDRLEGGGRDDDLRGDAGDDVLVGGNGRDRLRGGSGNDSIRARGDGAVDTVDCGSGRQDRVLRDTRDRVKGCERFGTRT